MDGWLAFADVQSMETDDNSFSLIQIIYLRLQSKSYNSSH